MIRAGASAITALSLLMSAATASAECAWVMWLQVLEKNRREPQYTNVTWTLVNSFASRESCDAMKADFPSDYKKTLERGDPVSIPVCLPDTVDPRGPKRSAR